MRFRPAPRFRAQSWHWDRGRLDLRGTSLGLGPLYFGSADADRRADWVNAFAEDDDDLGVSTKLKVKRKREDPYAGRGKHLAMLNQEVDRQRASVASRADSSLVRSSILIAAAGITIGAVADDSSMTPLVAVSVTLAVLAAIAGIGALWPRSGPEHAVMGMRDDVWNKSATAAADILLARKVDVLKHDERLLRDRARWLRIGFVVYAASLVVLIVARATA